MTQLTREQQVAALEKDWAETTLISLPSSALASNSFTVAAPW